MNPAVARRVVLGEQPPLKHEYEDEMDDDMLFTMLEQMGSVAGVYYKEPASFITPKLGPKPVGTLSPIDDEDIDTASSGEDIDTASSGEDSDEDIDIFSDEEKKSDSQEQADSDSSFDDIFK